MITPNDLGFKKGHTIPLECRFNEETWYLVEVALSASNVIHRAILYCGFIDKNMPGAYSKVIGTTYEASYNEVYYCKIINKLDIDLSYDVI